MARWGRRSCPRNGGRWPRPAAPHAQETVSAAAQRCAQGGDAATDARNRSPLTSCAWRLTHRQVLSHDGEESTLMITTVSSDAPSQRDLEVVLAAAAQQLSPTSPVVALLQSLASALARGADVTAVSHDHEFTTNEAASLIGMSCPLLLAFMDSVRLAEPHRSRNAPPRPSRRSPRPQRTPPGGARQPRRRPRERPDGTTAPSALLHPTQRLCTEQPRHALTQPQGRRLT